MDITVNLSPKDVLASRGIYEKALEYGWIEAVDYWHYPIFSLAGKHIATRAKAYPDTQATKGKKNKWIPEKPDNPESDYYILPGTIEAIRDADGIAYLANGEASVLAMHAAGMKNSFTTCHGESTVPKSLIPTLQLMGITKLINIADKDAAGMKAAAKWRDALRNSSIEYQAKQWPAYLPEKADFNDLWIALHFDAQAAQKAVQNCETLLLPQIAPKPIKETLDPTLTPQGLIDAIASALDIHDWKSDGFSRKNVHCLFHDDQHESAGFNRISGVFHCFAQCGGHSPKATAEKLGIDWRPFYPERKKRVKKPIPAIEDTPPAIDQRRIRQAPIVMEIPEKERVWAWIDQDELPLSWVKAMLHLCHSRSATVVYAIRFHRAVRRGEINPQGFTIEELQIVLGAKDDDGNWRKAPRLSVQNFIDTMTAWYFLWIIDTTLLDTTDKVTTSIINSSSGAGRPKTYYTINTHTEGMRLHLAELLEPALLEALTDKELAPRTTAFRDSLDLSLEEYRLWQERTTNPRHEMIIRQISERVCDVLENNFAIEFSNEDLQHPSDLRGKLLRMELAPYSRDKTDTEGLDGVAIREKGVQLSRGKLALELGCSESSLSKLYEENNVGVKRIRGWVEVERPNDCDILLELREAPLKLNRDLGGVAVGIRMKVFKPYQEDSEYLALAYGDAGVKQYDKWNGHIDKLYIFVEQPSLLWLMNDAEIAEKQAKEAELSETDADIQGAKQAPEKAEKKARKKSFVAKGDRVSIGLSQGFQDEQMAREVHRYTWHKLSGLNVLDKEENLVVTVQSYAELVIWLNRNASKKAVRSEFSYFTGVEDMQRQGKNVVYYIQCDALKKTYVGTSSDINKDIQADFAALAKKKHPCKALQAAFNEFGKDSLQWGVIEALEAEHLEGAQEYWIRKISSSNADMNMDKPFAVFNPILESA